jgi:hypothetical protein
MSIGGFMFTNQYVDIWAVDTLGTIAITVKGKYRLMNELNVLTGYYPTNESFKSFSKTDEPVFKIKQSQIQYVAANSEYLGLILRQIGKAY